MQVILLEKMRNLGELGATVSVKKGYGRNFLIPQGKAVMASKANLHAFEDRRAELEANAATRLAAANARLAALEALGNIEMKARCGDEGRLFGSIGTADIAAAIEARGFEISRNEIRIGQSTIRQIGEFEMSIHLQEDVNAVVKLIVSADS